ncbi:MAG TPA: acyl-CoA dehydrogenase family protein [Frankiaceae bacterium]|jgi:alkylation response protein AidB-like acyl-CoA dehydrogenase|nr:acyl-CoA dehydrogenase family protein [Frankiaceae bacterium]
MDVRLSHEQELISATAARLGAQHAITGIRDLPPTPEQSATAWDALARAGLLGIGTEGESGAAVASALVAERLAEALCPVPYVGQGILAPALLAASGAASDAEALASGEARYCVLLTADLSRFASPDEPVVAFDALGASHGLTVDAGGVLRRHLLSHAGGQPTLDRTRVAMVGDVSDPGELLGVHALDGPDRDRLTALAMTALAADQLGLCERALAMAVKYAGEREQFGRVIGANQALAHLLADGAVLVEACRSTVWHAAWAVDALGSADAREAATHAKAFCGTAAREVVEIALQAHGGIAVTWEHPLHLLLRRVMFDGESFGAPRLLHAAIAERRLAGPVTPSAPASSSAEPEGLTFADSPLEADFRQSVRDWLRASAPGALPPDGDERMAAMHVWHRDLAAAGFVGVSFAREYGGHGHSLLYDAIVNDELAAAGAPPGPAFNHIANAIRLFGTEEQKREHLPGLLDCTVHWCQGFSEPGAGSDLASLSTRGELTTAEDGSPAYRVDGQKLWTSEAVWADWCLLLLRTESEGRQHQQLSMLMVPMTTPGIDCRPVRTAYDSSEFAEVFYTGAMVPAAQRLGKPGQGWEIAMALLGFERGPADMGWTARLRRMLTLAEARIRDGSAAADAGVRQRLAEAWVELEALRLQVLRSTSNRLDGSAPGPDGSLDKLLMTRAEQLLNHALLDLAGPAGVLGEGELWANYIWSRAQGIFGGSRQIQRDIVAQRVLGLPRPGH